METRRSPEYTSSSSRPIRIETRRRRTTKWLTMEPPRWSLAGDARRQAHKSWVSLESPSTGRSRKDICGGRSCFCEVRSTREWETEREKRKEKREKRKEKREKR